MVIHIEHKKCSTFMLRCLSLLACLKMGPKVQTVLLHEVTHAVQDLLQDFTIAGIKLVTSIFFNMYHILPDVFS